VQVDRQEVAAPDAPFGPGKHVEIRDEEASAEGPEQLKSARRRRIGAEPVEQQVARVCGGKRHRETPGGFAGDLPCHGHSDNQDESGHGEAVRGGSMEVRDQEVGVWQRGSNAAPDRDACEPRLRAGTGAAVALPSRACRSSRLFVTGQVPDRDAGEEVAGRARHAVRIIAFSAIARTRGESLSVLATCLHTGK
jgi:hypothetical protein